jgi:hypothetical protein
MPLVMAIIDSLDAKSAGRVYFDLWCRAFDDFVVDVRDEYEFAFSSGYAGQRAIRTWRERIDVLAKLGFVKAQATAHGTYRWILILDPHQVVEGLAERSRISVDYLTALKVQRINIGNITA